MRVFQVSIRILGWLAALFGLTVSICAAVLWVRSYRQADVIGTFVRVRSAHQLWLYNGRGVMWLGHLPWDQRDPSFWRVDPPSDVYYEPFPKIPHSWGFGYLTFTNGGQNGLALPHWFVVAAAAMPPVVGLWKLVRRFVRKVPPGLCPQCRYDLRAHQVGQRCPECGWEIPADFKRESASPWS